VLSALETFVIDNAFDGRHVHAVVETGAVVDVAGREVVDEPWFLVVLIGVAVGLLGVVSCVVVAVLYQRHTATAARKSSKQPVLDGTNTQH